MRSTNQLAITTLIVIAIAMTGCAAQPTSAPTVTVTVTPEAAPAADGDVWQRFKDDPREAFVFSSAYELIWGTPIGNGELADSVVAVSSAICLRVEGGATWEEVQASIDSDDAESYILTAQVYCPEID